MITNPMLIRVISVKKGSCAKLVLVIPVRRSVPSMPKRILVRFIEDLKSSFFIKMESLMSNYKIGIFGSLF